MHHAADILVVDDEANIVDLIVEVLNEEGYKVRRAHDGNSALAQIAVSTPGMILLDLSMPDMIGTTLLQRIRTEGIGDMPVVIMTASSQSADVFTAIGATDFLPKPFDLDDLLNCVARHVPSA